MCISSIYKDSKPAMHTLLRWCGNGERDLGWCNNEIPLFSDKIDVLPLPLQYASALFRLSCAVPFSFKSCNVIMIIWFIFHHQKFQIGYIFIWNYHISYRATHSRWHFLIILMTCVVAVSQKPIDGSSRPGWRWTWTRLGWKEQMWVLRSSYLWLVAHLIMICRSRIRHRCWWVYKHCLLLVFWDKDPFVLRRRGNILPVGVVNGILVDSSIN